MDVKEPRKCKIFNCDRRHGNYCCAECGYRGRGCKNHCQNTPDRCNCVVVPKEKKTGGNTKSSNTKKPKRLTPQQKEMALYEAAVDKWGSHSQILIAIEEMSELTKALLKFIRYGEREGVLDAIQEERADVSIMLNQLEVIFGDNSEEECKKLDHLEDLLKKE